MTSCWSAGFRLCGFWSVRKCQNVGRPTVEKHSVNPLISATWKVAFCLLMGGKVRTCRPSTLRTWTPQKKSSRFGIKTNLWTVVFLCYKSPCSPSFSPSIPPYNPNASFHSLHTNTLSFFTSSHSLGAFFTSALLSLLQGSSYTSFS